MALSASGARLAKRVYNVREGVTERAVLEALNGEQGRSKQELEKLISIPNTSIFAQFSELYVAPILWGAFLYVILRLVDML